MPLRSRGQTGTGGKKPAAPAGPARTAWVALAVGMVLLVVVLVFIIQNQEQVKISFLWFHWHLALAVGLLLATVLGGLIVFTAGAARIWQLRRVLHQHAAHHEATAAAATPPTEPGR